MAERSKYQEKVIRNYYQNRDSIALQRLGELVTELYLAEGKGRARAWQRVVTQLETLKVPAAQIEHLKKSDNPALVAETLKKLMDGK